MFSYGSPHMAEQKQDVLLEPKYSSSVRIRDIALRICQKLWTIGRSGKKGSEISVLVVRQNDDDDSNNLIHSINTNTHIAQSARFVGYTDCISEEGLDPSPTTVLDMTLTKPGDEVPVIVELWGMQSTPSLPSLPGPLCFGVVAPNRVLSMGQIELNCTYDKLNCLK